MKFRIIIAILGLLVLTNACKTKEALGNKTKTSKAEKEQKAEDVRPKSAGISSANFSKMQINVQMNGNSLSTSASMKLIRDSILQFSIQPALGIEMFRMEFHKTHFIAVDKMNGRYFQSDYDFLYTKFRIKADFYSLQALVLDELFLIGQSGNSIDSIMTKFTVSPYPEGYLLRSKIGQSAVPTDFSLDKESRINNVSLTMPLSVFSCRYQDFSDAFGAIFPSTLKITIMEGPTTKKADIMIQSAEFNKPVRINTTNLSNYEQVSTFEQLIP